MALFTRARQRFIGGILLLLIGIPLLIGAVVNLVHATASTSWPAVAGVVDRSEVVETSGRRGKRSYKAEINYSYTVDGRRHRGNKLTFLESSWSSPARAAQVQAQYPVGAVVDVYYDPQNPARTVLEPGVNINDWAVLVAGLVCLAAGISFGVWPVMVHLRAGSADAVGIARPIEEPASFPPRPLPTRPRPVAAGPSKAPAGARPDDGIHMT